VYNHARNGATAGDEWHDVGSLRSSSVELVRQLDADSLQLGGVLSVDSLKLSLMTRSLVFHVLQQRAFDADALSRLALVNSGGGGA
jgi:hypothetical protein